MPTNELSLQLDVLSGPVATVAVAVAIYQAVSNKSKREINWSRCTISPALASITDQSKAAALMSVITKRNMWWKGPWSSGTQLGPFWSQLAINQVHPLGKSLLAVALELSMNMASTEASEVIMSLLQPRSTSENAAVIKAGDGASKLMVGDVLPALEELAQHRGSYLSEERVRFEKEVLRRLGPFANSLSNALLGLYTPSDVAAAIDTMEELLKKPEGSVAEMTCGSGTIKLAFLISTLFGVTVTVLCDGLPNSVTVAGYNQGHSLRIKATNKSQGSTAIFTPHGGLRVTQATSPWATSIHTEACVEHISVLVSRWQFHWDVKPDVLELLSQDIVVQIWTWWEQAYVSPSLYSEFHVVDRLGKAALNNHSGSGPGFQHGMPVKDIVTLDELLNVYKACMREHAIPDYKIWGAIEEEKAILDGRKSRDWSTPNPLALCCRYCHRHMPRGSSRTPGTPSGCAADDGHNFFRFLTQTIKVLALVDLEQPVFPSSSASPFTPTFSIGNIFHGAEVRKAVSLLPDGNSDSSILSYGHIVHAAAWIFGGHSGGLLAEGNNTVGVSVNDVSVIGSFCFEQTIQPRDCRLHVSYGKALFQGATVRRFVSYSQSVYGIVPADPCMGKPVTTRGLCPSLEGIDAHETSLTPVVNLRDDVATLALRIRWLATRTVPHSSYDTLASPGCYLRGLFWHLHFGSCQHKPETPVNFDGSVRVCDAGSLPQRPNTDNHGNPLWPSGYIPNPSLPSPGGFDGCILQTKGCFPINVAVVCDTKVSQTAVLQRDMCLECTCNLAAAKKAALVICW